jgi:anthranilate synthase component 2
MLGSIKPDLKVIRNDALTVGEIDRMKPEGIILSPGPGRPEDAGVCIDLVKQLGPSYPLLGVCLGHQAICTAYGAVVSYAKELMHGKVSECGIDPACPLFAGLDSRIRVGRYHSLAALEETMPECLKVTARTGDGEIMAVKHAEYDVYGVQFHPESILTPDGEKILRNFIDITGKSRQ